MKILTVVCVIVIQLISICVACASYGVRGGQIYNQKLKHILVRGKPAAISKLSDKFQNKILIFDAESGIVINEFIFDKAVSSFSISNSGNIAVVCLSIIKNGQSWELIETELHIYDNKYKQVNMFKNVTNGNGVAFF